MSQKKLSLQEQLLKAGLVSSAKAKSIKTEQRKQSTQQRHNAAVIVDDAKLQSEKIKAEQLQKDQELNQKRQQQQEQKQLLAQVKQLIELNKLKTDEEDGLAYRFTDNGKVKVLYVSDAQRRQLSLGRLAIVKSEKNYFLVNADVAEKITARNPASVVVLNAAQNEQTADSGDPYAAYQIPDDLVW